MRKRITKIMIAFAIISVMVLCFVACNVQKGNSTPKIEINSAGYWVIDGETTTVKAQGTNGTNGKDGISPTISINKDGYWIINGETTTIKAQGKDGSNGTDGKNGKDGKDGTTPTISINQNGYWVINGEVTSVKAQGKDGVDGANGKDGETPTISINDYGYWVINGETTTIKAQGKDGNDGKDGINGIDGKDGKDGVDGTSINKVVLDKNTEDEPILVFYEELSDGTLIERCSINIKELCGKDGINGEDGITPTISIDMDGYWVINGETTTVKAQGSDGKNGTDGADGMDGKEGKNIFELYKELYGYEGTVNEWLKDVLNGTFGSAIKHTVTFDYNGSTPLDDMPSSVEVVDGRTIDLPEPTREGYTFLGWYIGNGVNDGQWLNTLVVSRDLNLVARWQGKEFEVRFETSTGVILKIEKVKYGNNATAPEAPHVEGCIFDGWDGETENITSNRTLRPVYTDIKYTITYVTDGGSTLPNNTYLYNEIPTPPKSPTKTGFFFVGWKLENAEDSELYAFDTPLTSDITLIAVWTDTIIINDVAGLKAIGSNLNAKYALGNNINLNGEEWTPLGEFKGTFDGKGYKIYNFVMNTATSEMGFFKTNSGTIKNIIFSDVYLNNTYDHSTYNHSYTSIVAARNSGIITNISIRESTIKVIENTEESYSTYIGSICAFNNGTIKDSAIDIIMIISINTVWSYDARGWNDSVKSTRERKTYVGGIVGYNSKLLDNNDVTLTLNYSSYAHAKAISSAPSLYVFNHIGGAIGDNNGTANLLKANINFNLQCTGTTSNLNDSSYNNPKFYHNRYMGGVVGNNEGNVTNSFSLGTFEMNGLSGGSLLCGGIVGVNKKNVQTNGSSIYFNAHSQGGAWGGIVGNNKDDAKISDCIFDGELDNGDKTACTGGIVGNAEGGIISNCIMNGTIRCAVAENVGQISGKLGSATIKCCVINGITAVTNSGTPQYISGNGNSPTKCYRTENAILTVGEETVEGSQGEIAVLKPSEEIYTAEFFYETLLFNEDIWAIKPDGSGVYLTTLKS